MDQRFVAVKSNCWRGHGIWLFSNMQSAERWLRGYESPSCTRIIPIGRYTPKWAAKLKTIWKLKSWDVYWTDPAYSNRGGDWD